MEPSYWHLPETPTHDFLQKVSDSGREDYKIGTPDLKRTKPAGPPKGKS